MAVQTRIYQVNCMVYDGREIANFILDFCDKKNVRVSNLALQKILYFCHVWSLVKLDRPLIRHQFEAWQFGPVLQYVYREFKDFEKQPITSRAYKLDARSLGWHIKTKGPSTFTRI